MDFMNVPLEKLATFLFLGTSVFAFCFTVMATPIDIFRNTVSCYTLWGYKADCGTVPYTSLPADWGTCGLVLLRWRFAEAFSIISIFFTFATVVLILLELRTACAPLLFRISSIASGGLASASLLIVWGLIVGFYETTYCPTFSRFGETNYDYGAGFGLFVTAFVLIFIGTGVQSFMFIRAGCTVAAADGVAEPSNEPAEQQEGDAPKDTEGNAV